MWFGFPFWHNQLPLSGLMCFVRAWSVIMFMRRPGCLGEGQCLFYSIGMEIFILQQQTHWHVNQCAECSQSRTISRITQDLACSAISILCTRRKAQNFSKQLDFISLIMARSEWFKQVSRKIQLTAFLSLTTDLKETKQCRVVRNSNAGLAERKKNGFKKVSQTESLI